MLHLRFNVFNIKLTSLLQIFFLFTKHRPYRTPEHAPYCGVKTDVHENANKNNVTACMLYLERKRKRLQLAFGC